MNKYKTYTDKQINNAVAHELGKKFVTTIGDDVRISGYNFDPCNNPADAMPIIIENGIGLLPYKKITPLAFDLKKGLGFGILVENDNIYRAAMEVFLMMKEEDK